MTEARRLLKLFNEADFDADDMEVLRQRSLAVGNVPKNYRAIQAKLTELANGATHCMTRKCHFNSALYAIQICDFINKIGKHDPGTRIYIEDILDAAKLAQERWSTDNPEYPSSKSLGSVAILDDLHTEITKWKNLKCIGSDFIYNKAAAESNFDD